VPIFAPRGLSNNLVSTMHTFQCFSAIRIIR
jgi:hypothetical protein